jgi:hypothetical protein
VIREPNYLTGTWTKSSSPLPEFVVRCCVALDMCGGTHLWTRSADYR